MVTTDPDAPPMPPVYAARAARRARAAIAGGAIGAVLAFAVLLFLFLVPPDRGRDWPVLALMAGWTAAGVFLVVRGVAMLRENGKGA